jgi:hypothetical protein
LKVNQFIFYCGSSHVFFSMLGLNINLGRLWCVHMYFNLYQKGPLLYYDLLKVYSMVVKLKTSIEGPGPHERLLPWKGWQDTTKLGICH